MCKFVFELQLYILYIQRLFVRSFTPSGNVNFSLYRIVSHVAIFIESMAVLGIVEQDSTQRLSHWHTNYFLLILATFGKCWIYGINRCLWMKNRNFWNFNVRFSLDLQGVPKDVSKDFWGYFEKNRDGGL